jgi:hypothetical protein
MEEEQQDINKEPSFQLTANVTKRRSPKYKLAAILEHNHLQIQISSI